MNIDDARGYFSDRCSELLKDCSAGTPWVFLGASAMIEYLAVLSMEGRGPRGFPRFVSKYLAQVRPEYRTFAFPPGSACLARQMYHVLRCGIVHSFSLFPLASDCKNCFARSIVLCHEPEAVREGYRHLQPIRNRDNEVAALFVAEDFVKDIAKACDILFARAREDAQLARHIEETLERHPPISAQP